MPYKFTIQDDAGTRKVGPLEVLAGPGAVHPLKVAA